MATDGRRRWRDRFAEAFSGVGRAVRREASFRIHLTFTVLVPVVAALLRCSLVEWCLLIGCVGAVLTAELLNTALETLFKGLDQAAKDRIVGCLDISAGAVLTASVTSVLIGGLIFGRRLYQTLPDLPT